MNWWKEHTYKYLNNAEKCSWTLIIPHHMPLKKLPHRKKILLNLISYSAEFRNICQIKEYLSSMLPLNWDLIGQWICIVHVCYVLVNINHSRVSNFSLCRDFWTILQRVLSHQIVSHQWMIRVLCVTSTSLAWLLLLFEDTNTDDGVRSEDAYGIPLMMIAELRLTRLLPRGL